MLKFNVLNRWSGEVQFTAEIEADDRVSFFVKLGLAVRWAKKTGADLRDADLRGADLRDADLRGVRADGYAFLLTNLKDEGVRVKAGCRNFTIDEAEQHWRETRGDTPLGRETALLIAAMVDQARARGYSL